MSEPRTCALCSTALPPYAGTGLPRTYCDTCRTTRHRTAARACERRKRLRASVAKRLQQVEECLDAEDPTVRGTAEQWIKQKAASMRSVPRHNNQRSSGPSCRETAREPAALSPGTEKV